MVKGFPVILSDRGAPFVAVEKNAPLATVAENGRGLPIRVVEKGAPPIILQGGAPWTPLDLFADGTDGTLWEPWDISTLFQDNTGTTPVTAGGDPVRLVLDKHLGGELGPVTEATGWTQSGGSIVTDGGSFELTKSASGGTTSAISTNTISTVKGAWYEIALNVVSTNVSYSVRLTSGTNLRSTVAYLTGTGLKKAYVFADIAAGNWNITVATTEVGTISATDVTAREIPGLHLSQSVLANAFTAVNSGVVWGIVSDYAGDVLSATLPFAIDGEILIAGTGGTIIEPVSYASGSTFNLGTDSYTGGTPGILRAIGTIVGVILLDRAFTEDEKAQLIDYYKGKGAKGLLVEGPELVTNGTFDTGIEGWTAGNINGDAPGILTWVPTGAMNIKSSSSERPAGYQAITTEPGRTYLVSAERVSTSAYLMQLRVGRSPNGFEYGSYNTLGNSGGPYGVSALITPTTEETYINVSPPGTLVAGIDVDNVSVRELRPQEDW